MLGGPAGIVFALGAALTVVVWALAAMTTHPRFLSDLRNLAAVAFFAGCAQPIAVTLLSDRQQSIIGAVSTNSSAATLAGELFNALVVGAWGLILVQRRRTGSTGAVLAGLWALAAARLISDALASEHSLPKDTLVIAAVASAIHMAKVDRATFLGWARIITRVILMGSLASIAVAPSWAFIGEGADGYDRTVFGLPRLSGLAPHPGSLSLVAVLAVLIEVGASTTNRRARGAGLAAAGACVILSQSNTGWIGTLVALLVLAAARHRAVRVLGFLTFTATLGALVAFPSLTQIDWTRGSDYIATISGRTPIWHLALDEFQRHPITGYGPTFLDPTYRGIYVPPSLQYASEGHNQFFQTLGENGLIGVVALSLVALASLLVAWRSRRADRGLTLAIVVAAGVWSLTGTPIYPSGLIVTPLLLFGLLVTRPVGVQTSAECLTDEVELVEDSMSVSALQSVADPI